jgi:hypothetical protein
MRLDREGMRRTTLAGSIAVCAVLFSGCGIYTVEQALNPPYGISLSSFQLKFTGDNESEFASDSYVGTGFTLWFKEKEGDPYQAVQYNGALSRPTIPITAPPPRTVPPGVTETQVTLTTFEYTVQIAYMEHPHSNDSFLELKDEGESFFFAVSAMGAEGKESEKAEFGQWPP